MLLIHTRLWCLGGSARSADEREKKQESVPAMVHGRGRGGVISAGQFLDHDVIEQEGADTDEVDGFLFEVRALEIE